jgi:hypothetical protein
VDYALALQLMGYERGSDGKAPSVDLANCGYVVFARLPIDSNVPGRVTLRRGGFVFLVIGAAHLAFGIVAYYRVKELPILATAGLSLAFDAAWVAVNTFFFIVYVATASHLWRTRATWSGRGDAIPAGATTSATP